MERHEFDLELGRIKSEKVKVSTKTMLNLLPDYFYEIPASSSGKYHPIFSLGDGGLVRHVKVALRVLEEMFRDEVFGTYDEYTQDLMRMALMLHDGFKSGVTNTGHTCTEHPLLMSDCILQHQEGLLISRADAEFVARLIRSHMGPWNTDKQGNEVLPKPVTEEEKLIHLCDYIASRNFLNVHFENNEIADSVDRPKILAKTRENQNKKQD